MNEVIHAPKFKYDCNRCKFAWNCGYTCGCKMFELPAPPDKIKLAVNRALTNAGLKPEFKGIIANEKKH